MRKLFSLGVAYVFEKEGGYIGPFCEEVEVGKVSGF